MINVATLLIWSIVKKQRKEFALPFPTPPIGAAGAPPISGGVPEFVSRTIENG
jgi:hypothetical protein